MTLTISKTNKGKPLLILNGFTYIIERIKDVEAESYAWRCTKYTERECRARVHTCQGKVLKSSENHNHSAVHGEIGVRVVTARLKNEAKETTKSTAEILCSATEGLSLEVVSSLPKLNSLKKKVQSVRNKDNKVINPATLRDLEIPEKYAILSSGEQFLLFDSRSDNGNRVIIFGTQKNLKHLQSCPHWFSDGTFKSSPLLFEQLFVVLGKSGDVTVPLLYCLIENRKQESYDKRLNDFHLTVL